jgi:hypothetical protein
MRATRPAEATNVNASTSIATGAVKSWISHPAELNALASATDIAALSLLLASTSSSLSTSEGSND